MVMQYRVCIRNTATGEERIESGEWEHEVSTILFHWLENNFSCDCNRHLQFLRAGGPGPENDPHWNNEDHKCGDSAYRVPWIEIDGVRHAGEVDARHE